MDVQNFQKSSSSASLLNIKNKVGSNTIRKEFWKQDVDPIHYK